MKNFYDLFIHELKKIYNVEEQIIEAMPKMIKAAHSEKLKEALQHHLKESRQQLHRLEDAFKILIEKITHVKCKSIEALIEEGREIMISKYDPAVKDAALIAVAQRIEHFEIASYGALKAYARHFKLKDIEELLDISSEEEGNANKKLMEIAEGNLFLTGVNKDALKRSA